MGDQKLTDEHVDRFTMGPHVHRNYRARATRGGVYGESRLSPEDAIESYFVALSEVSFEPEDETPLVESRLVTPWMPIETGEAGRG